MLTVTALGFLQIFRLYDPGSAPSTLSIRSTRGLVARLNGHHVIYSSFPCAAQLFRPSNRLFATWRCLHRSFHHKTLQTSCPHVQRRNQITHQQRPSRRRLGPIRYCQARTNYQIWQQRQVHERLPSGSLRRRCRESVARPSLPHTKVCKQPISGYTRG